MSNVIAAVDNSAAAGPVVSMAVALGQVLGADVEAVHVSEDEGETACAIAHSYDVPCAVLRGDPFACLMECANRADVVAVVVGARRRLRAARIGHLAKALADNIAKPVLVVPPEARRVDRLRTVLIAMEGTPAKARSLKSVLTLAAGAELEIVVVHVDDEDSIPSFSDQVAHETAAYASEFLARHLHGAPSARLELRIGVPADEVMLVTDSVRPDILAIGWPQHRSSGRGATAEEILDRAHVPVLLVAVSD